MKRLAAVLLLLGACDNPAPPPATPPGTSSSLPALYNPEHEDMKKEAPAEYKVAFETDAGNFVVAVKREWAPKGADRFYNLVRSGFYDGARFFRVVPGFVTQFGLNAEPRVSAAWKRSTIPDDPVKQGNARGTITFATSGPNSRTTQVFINFKDNANLDGMGFSPFGKVLAGMDVVDRVNAEYGEQPNQGRIEAEGNAYLGREFPRLSFILKARVGE